jgi:hypothetical protein
MGIGMIFPRAAGLSLVDSSGSRHALPELQQDNSFFDDLLSFLFYKLSLFALG